MTPDATGPDAAELLRHRVARFGLMMAIVAELLALLSSSFALMFGDIDELLEPEVNANIVASFAFLGIWVLCRKPGRPVRFVRRVESAGIFLGSWAFAAMGIALPLVAQPAMIVLLALTYMLCAHAAYVPGSARRTLLVGALVAVPYATSVFVGLLAWDDRLHRPPAADWPPMTGLEMAVGGTIFNLLWWAISVTVAAGISHALYGLRREVAKAKSLGQYVLEEKLGEGGMGVVYRARHAMLRRPTAIKLLPKERVGERSLARFEREVQRTASLTHPNTVTVFDYGRTADGVFYYAMELLDGATLGEVVDIDGPQPAARVIALLDQAAGALAEAHEAGLIHRDIKPANILLVERGGMRDVIKIVDFGLVKDVAEAETEAVTQADTILGTPQYMSPEGIAAPDAVDARSDLYALGAVAYYLLTGVHVFTGKTMVEVCAHHLHSPPVPPSERAEGIPKDLEAIVLECLAKRADERPENASALRRRLRECADDGRWTQDDAAAWWTTHRDQVKARRASVTPSDPKTIQAR